MRRRDRRGHLILLCCAAGLGIGAGVVGHTTRALSSLELSTVDRRFAVRGPESPPRDLLVVQVDDVTLDELDLQWPFPRSVHARLIDRLREAGVRAIAYDVQFTEPTQVAEDNALIEAVARTPNVVLATTEVGERGEANVFGGDEVLREIGARAGNAATVSDVDGTVRRMAHSVDGLEVLALPTAEAVSGRAIPASELGGATAPIDFRGPPGTIEAISFSWVLHGKVDPAGLRGRVVVVGGAAPRLKDVHATSTTGANELMSGPELHANQIDTALRGFPLRSAPWPLDLGLVVLLGLVAPVASLRRPPLRALALALGAGLLYVVAVQLAFAAGWITSLVYPLVALALSAAGTLAVEYLLERFQRQRIRTLFARFVPAQVVDEVLALTDDDLRLAGTATVGTVLFSDLRGFTSFAEALAPARVMETLNVYLSEMSDAIMNNGGTLVAFMGDGIMAVFGAPIDQRDHADRALRAARSMLGERLDSFNAWVRAQGLGDGFRMGVGVHSGAIMSGNVGSEQRMEYAVIGDTTNVAARLEAMTKHSDHVLLMADSTRTMLTGEAPGLVSVGELPLRGREQPIRVWSLG